MTWETWTLYAAAYLVVSLTPGPAVLFVTSQSAWRGRRAGLAAALGIESANVVFWILTALGLATLITASHAVFLTVKWIGVLYLAWLGYQAIAGSFKARDLVEKPERAVSNAFRDAFVVGMSNPKALLFFVALVPQFVDPTQAALPQVTILALSGLCIDFSIIAGYALAAGSFRRMLENSAVKRWYDRGVGGLFIGLAALAALYRRAT